MSDLRRLWLVVLAAAWALAFGYAFVAFWTTAPTGVNRVAAFLGWQGVAGMAAFGVWGVGRAWPRGSSARRLSAVPLALALLLAAAILGVVAWARL